MPTAPRPTGAFLEDLFDKEIQIGADHGIIEDEDFVYVLPKKELRQVDYFHGIRNGSAMCKDEYDDHWFDFEMIHAGGPEWQHFWHTRPTVRLIRLLQRRFRRYRHAVATKRYLRQGIIIATAWCRGRGLWREETPAETPV